MWVSTTIAGYWVQEDFSDPGNPDSVRWMAIMDNAEHRMEQLDDMARGNPLFVQDHYLAFCAERLDDPTSTAVHDVYERNHPGSGVFSHNTNLKL